MNSILEMKDYQFALYTFVIALLGFAIGIGVGMMIIDTNYENNEIYKKQQYKLCKEVYEDKVKCYEKYYLGEEND